MVLHISHDTTLAYLVLENFRGLELPRTRTRTRTRTLAPRTRTRKRTWKLTTTLFVAEVANLSRLSVTSMLYSHNSLPLESNYRQRCAKYRYMGFSPRYCIWQCCVSQTCQTSHCRHLYISLFYSFKHQTEVWFWCRKSAVDTWQLISHSLCFNCFVAERYILQRKCLKKRIGSLLIWTRRYNFPSPTPTLRATIHIVSDRQTDRRHYHANRQ